MFNAKMLHAASLFVSADKTRYYLAGVRVEPDTKLGGSWYVATDGHCLFAGHDTHPIDTPTGEHLFCFDAKLKNNFSKIDRGVLSARGNQYVFTAGGAPMVAHDTAAACTFPDWRRVVEGAEFAEPSEKNLGFNPDYLAKFAKARQIITGSNSKDITPSRTNNGPAYIPLTRNADGPLYFGIIMPMLGTQAPTEPHHLFKQAFGGTAAKAA